MILVTDGAGAEEDEQQNLGDRAGAEGARVQVRPLHVGPGLLQHRFGRGGVSAVHRQVHRGSGAGQPGLDGVLVEAEDDPEPEAEQQGDEGEQEPRQRRAKPLVDRSGGQGGEQSFTVPGDAAARR